GQAPLPPALHLEHLAAQALDPLRHAIHLFVHPVLVEPGVDDERRFVLGHGSDSSLRTRRLKRFMAASSPSPTQHCPPSAAVRRASATSDSSASPTSSSTWSRSASVGASPTPMRSRANSQVPSVSPTLSSPRWPPLEPPARSLTIPTGR